MIRNIVLVGLFLIFLVNLFMLSFGVLTQREVGLQSTTLALVAIVFSWVVAQIYSESTHKKALKEVKDNHLNNLRTYALNAAEKVNNISVQLNRLSLFLQEGLEADFEGQLKETLRSREERLFSAIHILETVKSFNDTSLSDWKGVIGDELDEQREAQQEREEQIRTLVDRVASLETNTSNNEHLIASTEIDTQLRAELSEIKRNIRTLASSVTGSQIPSPSRRNPPVTAKCPKCQQIIQYSQYDRRDNIRGVKCNSCDSQLVSTYSKHENSLKLEIPVEKQEEIFCPQCENKILINISNALGSKVTETCPKCHQGLRIKRNSNRLRVTKIPIPKPVSEEIITRVNELLPKQPWPTGTHKMVQQKLGITSAEFKKACEELINRGVFLRQIDGVLIPQEVTDNKET